MNETYYGMHPTSYSHNSTHHVYVGDQYNIMIITFGVVLVVFLSCVFIQLCKLDMEL
jgi:hypothetical protein